MRKIELLANEKFEGDIKKAIKYIFYNHSSADELNSYINEFNSEESIYALEFLDNFIAKNVDKKTIDKVVEERFNLDFLNLTKEEIKTMEVNPYKAEIGKKFFKLLIVDGGLAALGVLTAGIGGTVLTTAIAAMGTIFSTNMAFEVSHKIMQYFKFKKLKKQYDKEETAKLNNGRSL